MTSRSSLAYRLERKHHFRHLDVFTVTNTGIVSFGHNLQFSQLWYQIPPKGDNEVISRDSTSTCRLSWLTVCIEALHEYVDGTRSAA